MSGRLALDFQAWQDHAQWWEAEGTRVREQMSLDDATIDEAAGAFGRIGASTVGTAYAAALRERRAAGDRLGAYAESVAAHIRRDLQSYADAERVNQQTLSS